MPIYKVFNFNLIILLTITLFFFITYPFIGDFGKNIFRVLYVITTFILLLFHIRFSKINIIETLSFLLFVGICIISALVTNFEFSMDNSYHLYSFIIFLFFIVTCNNIKVDKKLLNFIYYFSVLVTIIFACYSQSPYAYWNGEIFVDRLTLGLYNANFTGMMLFYVFSLIIITKKYNNYKFFSILLEIVLLYLIFLTGSRTSLFSSFLVLIISKIDVFRKKIPNFIILLICAIPFFFVKLYFNLFYYFGQDTIVMGREIFNRGDEYINYLGLLRIPIHFVIGNIGESLLRNAFNAPLAIFISIGILGTIFYYFIIIKKIIDFNNILNANIAKISIVVILACFVYSSGEAACFLGVFPISVFMYVFFVLAGTKEENIK